MLATFLFPRVETIAKGEPSDPTCPSADRAIQTYARLAKRDTTRVADAIAAADSASAAFDSCGDTYRAAGDDERAHYASVGSAQYRLTAGRLLHLTGDIDRAREKLSAAIAGVADTIAWGTPQEPSRYQAAAIAVRDAAQDELAKLTNASPPQ
jgi:hypothetical protein